MCTFPLQIALKCQSHSHNVSCSLRQIRLTFESRVIATKDVNKQEVISTHLVYNDTKFPRVESLRNLRYFHAFSHFNTLFVSLLEVLHYSCLLSNVSSTCGKPCYSFIPQHCIWICMYLLGGHTRASHTPAFHPSPLTLHPSPHTLIPTPHPHSHPTPSSPPHTLTPHPHLTPSSPPHTLIPTPHPHPHPTPSPPPHPLIPTPHPHPHTTPSSPPHPLIPTPHLHMFPGSRSCPTTSSRRTM